MQPEVPRMQTLEELGLLPNVAEERFDRITRLAQRMFDVLTVSIVLADGDRQWFKSRQGFDTEWLPRTDGLAQFAMQEPLGLVVEDLTEDPRFRDHPVVAGERRLRFFAGYPLTVGGAPVGALCLSDRRKQRFNWADRLNLRELAMMAEYELTDSDELDQAARIQRSLMPGTVPVEPGWDVAALCLPARSVGGDFVDWHRQDDGRLVMTVADVMGKGIGAGILAATVRAALRTASRTAGPAAAVRAAAQTLDDDLDRSSSLVTVLHWRLDPATGVVEWVDAGHGLQLILRAGGGVERSTAGGMPLGAVPDDRWPSRRTTLHPGDTMITFSDGLLELYDGTLTALDDIVRVGMAGGGAEKIVAAFAELSTTGPLLDDVTVVVTRRLR